MNKLIKLGAIAACLLMTYGYADDYAPVAQDNNYVARSSCANGACPAPAPAEQNGCPADCPADQPLNDCWCLYVHYEPCTYCTKRCVQECYPCKKRCCRKVPKYYEVKKCRMVPEYYCETACKYENEYYDVEETKTCNKWVTDQHVKYVPKYYWKHVCGKDNCNTPCPSK